MKSIIALKIFIILLELNGLTLFSKAQQTHMVLEQGPIVGFRIYPDATRRAVYAFLGVPYAQPPLGYLRFSPPKPHAGWNSTLQAINMKPICPQLTNTVYDEVPEGAAVRPIIMDEDCLYLNIWMPEINSGYNDLPVLAVITGEEMSYDWPLNRATGLDFALEDVVVVTIQYRQNIFGWLRLENTDLKGNYGLQDQRLALQWIQRNINKFGGDPNKVTLFGHGTSGAPCAMAHLVLENSKLFSKLILMSGGDIETTLNSNAIIHEASRQLVQKLGCQFEKRANLVISCLRMKSVSDLLNSFESIYDHGNETYRLGPIVPIQLRDFIGNRTFATHQPMPPIMMGISTNEGAFFHDYWLDLARQGYTPMQSYINYTLLPKLLQKFEFNVKKDEILVKDAITLQYFYGESSTNVINLINAMQRVISEAYYEVPFFETLELIASGSGNSSSGVYAYIFEFPKSMDMRGKVNLFGGASHSSDLPILLGPSLYQQISRRRFTIKEEKICRKMRTGIMNFIKSENPTPNRIYDAWLPYTNNEKFIFNIAEDSVGSFDKSFYTTKQFEENLPLIKKLIDNDQTSRTGVDDRFRYYNNYQISLSRLSKTDPYQANQYDSGYAVHLRQIHRFWRIFLPKFAKSFILDASGEGLEHRVRYMEVSANATRYKQGFYVMLGLVVVLLVILGLCVYFMRRDSMLVRSRESGFCL